MQTHHHRRPLLSTALAIGLFSSVTAAPSVATNCQRADRHRKAGLRGQTIKAGDALEVKTSREVTPADGQIAICIGPLDLSKQTRAVSATTFRAEPGGVALPAGQQEVVVHLIRGDQWIDLAKFTVTVEAGW